MTWRDPLRHSAQPAGCSPRTGPCSWSMGWSPRSSRSLPHHGNELSTAGALCPACPVPWETRRPQPPEPSCVPRCFISTPSRRASARWRSYLYTPTIGASTDCSGEADPGPPGPAKPSPAAGPSEIRLLRRRCVHESAPSSGLRLQVGLSATDTPVLDHHVSVVDAWLGRVWSIGTQSAWPQSMIVAR
jgi:hypothetical protein